MFQLRPYQERVLNLTVQHLYDYPQSQPLIVAPCAAGKSVIIAALCTKLSALTPGMVLVMTHRKELVVQNAGKLPEHMNVGVFSAGAGRKELRKITVAGFQTIRNHAEKLPQVGFIVIDEADYAQKGYREFIDAVRKKSPDVRVLGLTATPYLGDANRTALHLLPADKQIFTGIAAEIQISELLNLGFLCPLTPYKGTVHLETGGVKVDARTGDFAIGALEAAVDTDELNTGAAREIAAIFADRRAVMVFAAGVSHAEHLRDALRAQGEDAECVLGHTPKTERDAIIKRFREGKLKYIVGVDVLLVGFDAPIMDGIAMLRPTLSGRVYVQALGRGMRIHPGKEDCLVCDFTDNTDTHGPIDEIEGNPPKMKTGEAPTKLCDNCFSIVLAGLKKCPTCGFEFEFRERDNQQVFDPTTGLLISGVTKNEDGSKTYPVERVEYEIRTTAAGNPALVANYLAPGRRSPVAICYYNMWHHSHAVAHRDGQMWLRRQRNPGGSIPLSAQEALVRAEMGALKTPSSVTVRPGSPWPIRYGASR